MRILCIGPEPTKRKHFVIADNRVHNVKREVFFTLFNVPQIKLFTPNSRRDCCLGQVSFDTQSRNRGSEKLPWRIRPSDFASSDWFGHIPIVLLVIIFK